MIRNRILIHGIGNEILTDDGIGPKLVKRLKGNLSRTDIDFETAFLGGLELLEYFQGYYTVIFIDAIRTKGGIPGTVYQLSPENKKSSPENIIFLMGNISFFRGYLIFFIREHLIFLGAHMIFSGEKWRVSLR